ncbi:ketopantoate reductase family protein [Pontibacter sp. MBLB2868]|uniref:ketopantoate reductase family protein n=1 Tax=Pontibacter sp. MBLB2868 TaxID=3451555 RepID=UPI003F752EDA
MKIVVIGAGGVGGYFGGKLAKAGFDVTFLARGAHLEAMKVNGLTVKSLQGDFHVDQVQATDSISGIGQADLIILGVKAWQIKEIAKDLKPILHADTLVLPLQNGVLAIDELKEYIPGHNILGGLCRIISKIDAPGVINHFGVVPTIVFGETDKSRSERTQQVKTIFDKAGIESQLSDDIYADLWKKFTSICISGLLAVSRTTYGELRELKETRQLMVELLREIHQLSQKVGIDIQPDFPDKVVAFIDTLPYDSTASLTRDVLQGKPSEIEYQNGTVVRLGEIYGVDTPVNRFIYSSILPMEIKARKVKV